MFESDAEAVSGIDTAWLRMDTSTNLMVINAMAVLEPLEFEPFRATIENRFLEFDRFLKRPVNKAGFYVWESDPHFDLDNHLHRIALPAPANKQELERFVGELASTPLDPLRPMWQFYFVENYQGGVAIIMRVHHCYADGMSLVAVFNSMTDGTANIQPLPRKQSSEQPGSEDNATPWPAYQQLMDIGLQSFEKYSRMSLKWSEESLQVLSEPNGWKIYSRQALKILAEIGRVALLPSDPESSLKKPLSARKRVAWSKPFPIAPLKQRSRELGCSVNDLLTSCLTGALQRHLLEAGDAVDGMTLHATVPVNIRPLQTGSGRSELKQLGNRFGAVFVPLPVGIRNPIERVYKIKHDMLELKRSLQPGVSFGMLYAVGMMPKQIQKPVTELFSRKSSVVMSNVPGPQSPRYLAGAEIKEQMFWVPQSGDVGLGVGIISYNGHVQFGVSVDKKILDQAEPLVDSFEKELVLHAGDEQRENSKDRSTG